MSLKKRQQLRNNEYYSMQEVFDNLHAKAKKGYRFRNLMPIISSEDNILLAYRNIKKNSGSMTAGTDKLDITFYKEWSEEKFVKYFQSKLQNYHPKSVRRVEIPKPNGKLRPLGIPCMDDRIIQQCIKQVLDPICESKFHNHSYGFRPNRSTTHAIARSNFLLYKSELHYVVDIDIKGFFDNVNHAKLKKQMWNLGIQDKNLITVIGKILKSEIQGIGVPDKGTPQGGIISPLLSNIILNELDWWLSDQWETFETDYKYPQARNKYRTMKKTNLKEFFFVRYADDFKIFCRDYATAKKMFMATKQWLKERLGLDISPDKSKITNVRKGKTEFLGIALFVNKKRNKYVSQSSMTKKAKQSVITNLKNQIKSIQKNGSFEKVNRLNAIILGCHNYYSMATRVNLDFAEINYIVTKSLDNRLKQYMTDKPIKSKTYQELYGKYNGKVRTIFGSTLFPIYGVVNKPPMNFNQEINNYTEKGRSIIHQKMYNIQWMVEQLLKNKQYDQSVEYNDNRISLFVGQKGKCHVTGDYLELDAMECHHKLPKSQGGTDDYKNLVWLCKDAHKLIHSSTNETIEKYLMKLNLDNEGLKCVNTLRKLVGNLEI